MRTRTLVLSKELKRCKPLLESEESASWKKKTEQRSRSRREEKTDADTKLFDKNKNKNKDQCMPIAVKLLAEVWPAYVTSTQPQCEILLVDVHP